MRWVSQFAVPRCISGRICLVYLQTFKKILCTCFSLPQSVLQGNVACPNIPCQCKPVLEHKSPNTCCALVTPAWDTRLTRLCAGYNWFDHASNDSMDGQRVAGCTDGYNGTFIAQYMRSVHALIGVQTNACSWQTCLYNFLVSLFCDVSSCITALVMGMHHLQGPLRDSTASYKGGLDARHRYPFPLQLQVIWRAIPMCRMTSNPSKHKTVCWTASTHG